MKDDNKKDSLIFTIVGIIIAIVIIVLLIIYISEKNDNGYEKENMKAFSELSYKIPEGFESDPGYKFNYFSGSDNNVTCSIMITSYEKDMYSLYKDPKDLLMSHVSVYLNERVGEIEIVDVGNTKGYYVSVISDYKEEYNYAIESKNYMYFIRYELSDIEKGDRPDLDTNKCYTTREEFIKSISVR